MENILSANKNAFYVLDTGVLKARINYLKSRLPKCVTICYAAKANPFVVKEIDEDIEKFELCSPGEVDICNTLGIATKKMVISGVYKTPEFIERLVKDESFEGVYTIESLSQYRLLVELSNKYERDVRVLVRLTNSSQFGVNEQDVEDILADLKGHKRVECIGIQFFSGTQKSSVKKLRRELEHMDAFLLHLRDDLGFEAEYFEYGGGFPVAYFENEEFDEEAYLAEFADALNAMTFKAKVTLELGRSVVASCGKYYTHVVDMKCNKGINYMLVDGGMHHIVYFGQQMAMKHPLMSVVGKEGSKDGDVWTICGALCSMNDILAKQVLLPMDIAVGDTLCFENAGAYCLMEGISLFLSRDLPSVYIVRENGETLLVREAFETSTLNTPNYNKQ
ncbi:MAG: alanine racemase [Clostridia bacterium]|nr:alanine racemase [Clostridia bacterium]